MTKINLKCDLTPFACNFPWGVILCSMIDVYKKEYENQSALT